jgi:hypothetical protein
LQVVRRGAWRIRLHIVPREFDINPRVTFVGKITLPCAEHYSWSLNLAKHQRIFWRHCRGTSRRIAHKKVFITNLCKRLSLGRLHLRDWHLVLLDLQSTLFLFCYCLAYLIILYSVLHYYFIFILHFYLLFVISVALVVVSFYFHFSF